MSARRSISCGVLMGLLPVLAGCAHMDELGDAPVAEARDGLPDGPALWQETAVVGEVEDGWLAAFEDPRLEEFVDEALRRNANLMAAAAQMDRAWAQAGQARSKLLPAANVGGSASRTRVNISEEAFEEVPQAEAFASGDIEEESSSAIGRLEASWELDIWGRARDGWFAAIENAEAAEAEYRAARLSIAGAVARSYFLTIEAAGQVELAEESVTSLEHLHRLVTLQVDAGVAREGDLAPVRANLSAAQARLAEAKAGQRQATRALELLLGRYPGAALEAGRALPVVPEAPPAGLPSSLLDRRPDVIAAERQVAAALYAESQAKKLRLPQLSLTGMAGAVSTDLSDILDPTATLMQGGASLGAPIFQGGAISAQIEAAGAEARAAAAQYTDTALNAFEEVETALDQGMTLRERQAALTIAVDQMAEAFRLERLRYEVGESSLVDVLQTEQQLINYQTMLLSVERMLRENYVGLNLALGGHWAADPVEF